jgi:hypothetical protein
MTNEFSKTTTKDLEGKLKEYRTKLSGFKVEYSRMCTSVPCGMDHQLYSAICLRIEDEIAVCEIRIEDMEHELEYRKSIRGGF